MCLPVPFSRIHPLIATRPLPVIIPNIYLLIHLLEQTIIVGNHSCYWFADTASQNSIAEADGPHSKYPFTDPIILKIYSPTPFPGVLLPKLMDHGPTQGWWGLTSVGLPLNAQLLIWTHMGPLQNLRAMPLWAQPSLSATMHLRAHLWTLDVNLMWAHGGLAQHLWRNINMSSPSL